MAADVDEPATATGVREAGQDAGDQGTMFGHATEETEDGMPLASSGAALPCSGRAAAGDGEEVSRARTATQSGNYTCSEPRVKQKQRQSR